MKNNDGIPSTDTNEIKQLINRVKLGDLDIDLTRELPIPFNPDLDQNLIRDRARVGGADGPKQDKQHHARERVRCGL